MHHWHGDRVWEWDSENKGEREDTVVHAVGHLLYIRYPNIWDPKSLLGWRTFGGLWPLPAVESTLNRKQSVVIYWSVNQIDDLLRFHLPLTNTDTIYNYFDMCWSTCRFAHTIDHVCESVCRSMCNVFGDDGICLLSMPTCNIETPCSEIGWRRNIAVCIRRDEIKNSKENEKRKEKTSRL